MKTTMNKQLYNFIQDKLQKNRQGGQIKNTALATKLYEQYNFGQFDLNKQWLTFSLENIIALGEEIQSTLGLDIRHDPYPSKEDRISSAEKFRNEKENSYAVSKDFILINSLAELNINQSRHKISPLTSLGTYIKADDIQSIEHSAIVLVENLAVMANLSAINLSAINLASLNSKTSETNTLSTNVPSTHILSQYIDLTQALWLYRGDVKPQQTANSSYYFFRRFKGEIPLICFSDLDPKGIEIALTSHADFWLTLKNTNEVARPLLGDEQEWYKQGTSIDFLHQQMNVNLDKNNEGEENIDWQHKFKILLRHKKTLKQEHILKYKLTLTLLKL
ncbi:MAG: hypothetical protein HRT51_13530 [Colwellia sp.]|nr:hypothetical protein [Colwellia sp.]